MNRVVRTFFFLSALAPAFVVSIGLNIYSEGINCYLVYWMLGGFVGCVFPFIVASAIAKHSEVIPFEAKKVESNDWLLIVVVATYFVPLIWRVNDHMVLLLILVGAALVLTMVSFIPCHPLLRLFKYRFYKVEGTNGLVYHYVTRKKIRSASDIKCVKSISDDMLWEVL